MFSKEEEQQMNNEGWCVSNTSLGFDEIQRIDEYDKFESDAAAIAHVYWMAGTGSALHKKAIDFTLREGNTWEYISWITKGNI